MSEQQEQGMTFHIATSIEGLLRNFKRKKINFLTDDDGKFISDFEARKELKEMLAKGQRLIRSSGCTKFDPVKGCLGHTKEELRLEKVAALKDQLQKLESNE